jgi:hypothetical protein
MASPGSSTAFHGKRQRRAVRRAAGKDLLGAEHYNKLGRRTGSAPHFPFRVVSQLANAEAVRNFRA